MFLNAAVEFSICVWFHEIAKMETEQRKTNCQLCAACTYSSEEDRMTQQVIHADRDGRQREKAFGQGECCRKRENAEAENLCGHWELNPR